MAAFLASFPPAQRSKLGFCVDTCHVFSAGTSLANAGALLDRLHATFPITLIHLNNSAVPLGGRKDSHEGLFYGHIPRAHLKGVVKWARLQGVPCILETTRQEHADEAEWAVGAAD
jgi:deoxyribonuclease IV